MSARSVVTNNVRDLEINGISRWARNDRILFWVVAGLALVGLFDASYLTVEHYQNAIPTCLVGSGCETVLTSPYATVGPIPIALLGALYYLTLFLGALALTDRPNRALERGLLVVATLGFLSSIGLVYLQAQVLQAFCTYCMISAGTTTAIFLALVGRSATQLRQAKPTEPR